MFQRFTTFMEINGALYRVLRTIKVSQNPIVDTWKEHLHADKVFKKEDFYFFVVEVPEAEIVA